MNKVGANKDCDSPVCALLRPTREGGRSEGRRPSKLAQCARVGHNFVGCEVVFRHHEDGVRGFFREVFVKVLGVLIGIDEAELDVWQFGGVKWWCLGWCTCVC